MKSSLSKMTSSSLIIERLFFFACAVKAVYCFSFMRTVVMLRIVLVLDT